MNNIEMVLKTIVWKRLNKVDRCMKKIEQVWQVYEKDWIRLIDVWKRLNKVDRCMKKIE